MVTRATKFFNLRKAAPIFLIFGFIVLSFYIALATKQSRRYSEFIGRIALPYEVVTDSREIQEFNVRLSQGYWQLETEMISGLPLVLDDLGFSSGLDGIIKFYCYRFDDYSWININRNNRNLRLAALLDSLWKKTVDNKIHLSQSDHVALFFLSKDKIYFLKEEDNQLVEGILVKGTGEL